jgi:hypothetical protein
MAMTWLQCLGDEVAYQNLKLTMRNVPARHKSIATYPSLQHDAPMQWTAVCTSQHIHSFMLHLWQKLIQATPAHPKCR